jgi:hypothetical protein
MANFRLTEKELLEWKERARAEGKNLSEWIKEKVTGAVPAPAVWGRPRIRLEKKESPVAPIRRELCERCKRMGVAICAACKG